MFVSNCCVQVRTRFAPLAGVPVILLGAPPYPDSVSPLRSPCLLAAVLRRAIIFAWIASAQRSFLAFACLGELECCPVFP
jgi:hypothetical protein